MIGNSHVAAMRRSWDAVASRYPDLAVEIFGAHANTLNEIELRDTSLIANRHLWHFNAGGETERTRRIRLHDYDMFAIVGCDFGPLCVMKTYRRFMAFGMNAKGKRPLAREKFQVAALRTASDSVALRLCDLISHGSSVPLLVVPTPLPDEAGFTDQSLSLMAPWIEAQTFGDGDSLMRTFDDMCRALAETGVTVVRQPDETKASIISTLHAFSDGSYRLNQQADMLHPENDYFHMNDDYGALMWRETASAIARIRARNAV
jgi:hypothetical protein